MDKDQRRAPDFVYGNIGEWYYCGICEQPLFKPVQLVCGARACSSCLHERFHGGVSVIPCPMKHYDEDRGDLGCELGLGKEHVHEDKAAARFLDKQEVYCPHKSLGCTERVQWRHEKDHVEICQFRLKKCPYFSRGCKELIISRLIPQHKAACEFGDSVCQSCCVSYQKNEEPRHFKQCKSEKGKCVRQLTDDFEVFELEAKRRRKSES